MQSRDFCYWLQGFFEIGGPNSYSLRADQVDMIKRHLQMVFTHEIDPSMGPPDHQQHLNSIHDRPDNPFYNEANTCYSPSFDLFDIPTSDRPDNIPGPSASVPWAPSGTTADRPDNIPQPSSHRPKPWHGPIKYRC